MAFLVLIVLGFCSKWQDADAVTLGRPVLNGPSVATVKSIVVFYCNLDPRPANLSLTFHLLKKGQKKYLSEYSALSGELAVFNKRVFQKYDGELMCKASGYNNSEITPTYSDWQDFRVLVDVKGARIISSPSSGDLWVGDSLILQCNITEGTYVSYDWLFNDRPVWINYNRSQNQLNIQRLSIHDSGEYTCVASNQFNDTEFSNSSDGRNVSVKEHLSEPAISFDIVKDNDGNLNANVTCHTSRGSTPIRFTLLKNNQNIAEEVSGRRQASFIVTMTLDHDMGTVQCQADNGRQVQSQRLNLTVESVGGAVTMTLTTAIGQDFNVYGVWLHCSVERGTFPHYHWFLNTSRLEGRGRFYDVSRRHGSDIFVFLTPSSAGTYHCEATNTFDNTTSVLSTKTLITMEELNRVPLLVTVIVFTCFSLLIITVLSCCIYGVVIRKKKSSKYILNEGLTELRNVQDEANDSENNENENNDEYDKLEEEMYAEDMDIVQASRIEEPDTNEEEEETVIT